MVEAYQSDIEKKINSLNTLAAQQKAIGSDATEAIADTEVRTSEKLIKVNATIEGSNKKIQTAIPVLTQFKERITRTLGMTNWDEPSLHLVTRKFLLAEELQSMTMQENELTGLDYTPTVNQLAQENEGLAQIMKGKNGWAGELIQTKNLNETIHQKTEEKIQQAKEEEKKKRFVLF